MYEFIDTTIFEIFCVQFFSEKGVGKHVQSLPVFFSCFFLSGIEILFTGSLETDSDLLEKPCSYKAATFLDSWG